MWIGSRFGVLPSIAAGLAVGLLVGTINGFLVAKVRIPAFIATLGMLFVVAGFTLIIAGGGRAFQYNAPNFVWMGNGDLLGVPVPFIIFLLCALIGEGVLRRTMFGRHVFAIGSNATAAKIAGVPVQSVLWRGVRGRGAVHRHRRHPGGAPGSTRPVRVSSPGLSCGSSPRWCWAAPGCRVAAAGCWAPWRRPCSSPRWPTC